jgi:hypothetical protein
MARKPVAKAALADPPSVASMMPQLPLGEEVRFDTCKNCDRYTAKVIGDHGRCALKPRTSMMKETHVCAIDRFLAKS